MEQLAIELMKKVNDVCIEYLFFKQTDVIEKTIKLSEEIKEFVTPFLQGNVFGMSDEEYENLKQYVMQVLEDYMEAIRQDDMVLMIDTLDYGLRELLNIYVEDDAEEGLENE